MKKKFKIHKGAVVTAAIICMILVVGVYLVENINFEDEPILSSSLMLFLILAVALSPVWIGIPYIIYRCLKVKNLVNR